ncbi:hypothetical protein ACTZWW_04085 [Salinarimonas sp. NSM]|uniref:hypothetical protein n=1 Tax=Salinarimonas sp. NSM TaxID=3458003 RepID=UPI00403702E4
MPRLLDWPVGLGIVSEEELSGPRAIGAGSNEAVSGFVQTFSTMNGLWQFRLGLPRLWGDALRAYRGMATGLHAGANAVRVSFADVDRLSYARAGLTLTPDEEFGGITWSSGARWSNGLRWSLDMPPVPLATPAPLGATSIELRDVFAGHRLDMGARIGFGPVYFGMHVVTEVFAPGVYRIWPGLRKALTTDDFATFRPIVAMRSFGPVQLARGLNVAEGLTLTLLEIPDPTVRSNFAD